MKVRRIVIQLAELRSDLLANIKNHQINGAHVTAADLSVQLGAVNSALTTMNNVLRSVAPGVQVIPEVTASSRRV